ncbi:chondroitinase [Marinilabiliaceae bacterium JC017]|nr:chondroitinase [Marinilabiliaceae bacterium JC017]
MKKSQVSRATSLLLITISLFGFFQHTFAKEFEHPSLWSFESLNKKQWQTDKGHKISTSEIHYKHGKKSLEWSWQKPGALILNHLIGFKPFDPKSEDKSIPSFAIWIYNETPVNDHARFVFSSDDTDNCWFNFNLNFKGWRAAWVSFERDMEGQPVTTMNRLRIESPQSVKKGQLCIDHMFLCVDIDSRHHTADHQVPFVNKKTTSHWLILEKASHITPNIPAPEKLSPEDLQAFELVEQRFLEDILKKQKVSEKTVDNLKSQLAHYEITRKKDQISGLPIWFIRNAELYIPHIDRKEAKFFFNDTKQDVKTFFNLMMKVATAHANCSNEGLKSELKHMFLDMYDHINDQGIADGSALGTIHHYGYNWRNYFRSLYIMKQVLRQENKLNGTIKGMQWYASVGEIFLPSKTHGMDMDAFNTQVMGRLASILIMEDTPQKAQYLTCFSQWINNGLLPAPGLNDAFKIDGSSYHHANNYPAYASGGMNGAVRMVYFLSGTPFKVSQQGHETLKKALLTMRLYCNLLQWPISMSGRHPDGKGKLDPSHFAILAKAGSPDGANTIDTELARAFLRLIQNNSKNKYVKEFKSKDITAEESPAGHWVMPFACTSIHRRDNWSATVRGHSRYLWASEHYLGCNLYGRYLAHGQLQIMAMGDPINNKDCGFVQKGWDWNRFPGTTVINLPVDSLKANILNVDQFSGYEEMLYSDESFAGGVQANNKNGVYAFILHEHDKYQGSLRARKSYFFFGNYIVCLGSGIENINSERPTETILFQNHMDKKDNLVVVNGKALGRDDFESNYAADHLWIIDNKTNGYYLPAGKIYYHQGIQHSRDEHTQKPTQARFTTAVIRHGNAPKNESYHYSLVVGATNETMTHFAQALPYEILQQDKQSHIVVNSESQETAYVFFEPAQACQHGIIRNTNLPCLAMSKMTNEGLELNVTNPDLALYEGPSDDIFENGKRVERSIYSRPWRSNESKPTLLEMELEGKWSCDNTTTITTPLPNGNTLIQVTCKDGLTQRIILHNTDNQESAK